MGGICGEISKNNRLKHSEMHVFCPYRADKTEYMNQNLILKSSYDGLNISILVVAPEEKPKAILQLAHGMCGCKERFIPLMNYLADNGVLCIASDHRGHGSSIKVEGDRGYMYSGGYNALVDDMKMVSDWAHQTNPELPLFLLGHSMGSLAARVYVKKYDYEISGLILCGSPSRNVMSYPGYHLAHLVALFADGRIRMQFIQKIVNRRYNKQFADEGPMAWLCSDQAVCRTFAETPQTNFTFTANASFALMSLFKETYSTRGWKVANPDMPVYFISGNDDPSMLNEPVFHDSVSYMTAVGYKDVSSALYSGMRHEVLNEIGKEAVWQDILNHIFLWIPGKGHA